MALWIPMQSRQWSLCLAGLHFTRPGGWFGLPRLVMILKMYKIKTSFWWWPIYVWKIPRETFSQLLITSLESHLFQCLDILISYYPATWWFWKIIFISHSSFLVMLIRRVFLKYLVHWFWKWETWYFPFKCQ